MSLRTITDDGQVAALAALLEHDYRLRTGAREQDRLTVLDAYDGRIWASGLLLTRWNDAHLRLFEGPVEVAAAIVSDEDRFWWDLPDGDMARRLERLLGARRRAQVCMSPPPARACRPERRRQDRGAAP